MMIQELHHVVAEQGKVHDCVRLHVAREVRPALEIIYINYVGRKSPGKTSVQIYSIGSMWWQFFSIYLTVCYGT